MNNSDHTAEEFHEFVVSHKHEDETIRRLSGPHPEYVAGVISSETAERMREQLCRKE